MESTLLAGIRDSKVDIQKAISDVFDKSGSKPYFPRGKNIIPADESSRVHLPKNVTPYGSSRIFRKLEAPNSIKNVTNVPESMPKMSDNTETGTAFAHGEVPKSLSQSKKKSTTSSKTSEKINRQKVTKKSHDKTPAESEKSHDESIAESRKSAGESIAESGKSRDEKRVETIKDLDEKRVESRKSRDEKREESRKSQDEKRAESRKSQDEKRAESRKSQDEKRAESRKSHVGPIAESRKSRDEKREESRKSQDEKRAESRKSQDEKRAESRKSHVGPIAESRKSRDEKREESRKSQDEKRAESRKSQDEKRAESRKSQDEKRAESRKSHVGPIAESRKSRDEKREESRKSQDEKRAESRKSINEIRVESKKSILRNDDDDLTDVHVDKNEVLAKRTEIREPEENNEAHQEPAEMIKENEALQETNEDADDEAGGNGDLGANKKKSTFRIIEPTPEHNQLITNLSSLSKLSSFYERKSRIDSAASKSFHIEDTFLPSSSIFETRGRLTINKNREFFGRSLFSQSSKSIMSTLSVPSGSTASIEIMSSVKPSTVLYQLSAASSTTMEILEKKKNCKSMATVPDTSASSTVSDEKTSIDRIISKRLSDKCAALQAQTSKLMQSRLAMRTMVNEGESIFGEIEEEADVKQTLEEILQSINDDDLYDLIFTYKLPKCAPFDVEQNMADIRIKCMENWLNDRGNALYKIAFEDEIKSKADEKFNQQLVARLISLLRNAKKCDVCQKPPSIVVPSVLASSCSTFSLEESLHFEKLAQEEEKSEESSTRPSSVTTDLEENAFSIAKEAVLNLISGTGKILPDLEPVSTGEQSSTDDLEDDSSSQLPAAAEDSNEDASVKRRQEIRFNLERIILFLEEKEAAIRGKKVKSEKGEGQITGSSVTIIAFSKIPFCSCDDPWLDGLEETLLLLFNKIQEAPVKEVETFSPQEKTLHIIDLSEIDGKKQPNQRQRLQMYILGLRQSWFRDNGFLENQPDFTVDEIERPGSLSEASTKGPEPNFCPCNCDTISRFNVKRKQHFRSVLDEHLLCYHYGLQSKDETEYAFKGWLADTDRNFLLMLNRSAKNRFDIDNYRKLTDTKKLTQTSRADIAEDRASRARIIEEIVTEGSRTEAERFWKFVENWYHDYRSKDKSRRLIDEFQKLDYNTMLKRDLHLLASKLRDKFEDAKENSRIKVESEQKQKFEASARKLRESFECSCNQQLAQKKFELDTRKEFQIRCKKLENEESFKPKIKSFKSACLKWLECKTKRSQDQATVETIRNAEEIRKIADRIYAGERLRTKLMGSIGNEHEELEKILGKAIKQRFKTIEELKEAIARLTRDVDIWKKAVGEILLSFRKYVFYILEVKPERAQYALNLERLYQLQMDGLIEDVQKELERNTNEKAEKEAGIKSEEELPQPAFEIKCPSHVIRSGSELTAGIGSSSDTDIDQDLRAKTIAAHAVSRAIRSVLPSSSEPTETSGEDVIETEQILSPSAESYPAVIDNVVKTKVTENICESTSVISKQKQLPVIVGDGASEPSIHIDEFTKRRVREMMGVISRKTSQIKPHVQL